MFFRAVTAFFCAAVAGQGPDESYTPLAKGYKWIYRTDYDENTELIHEVTGSEKVGEVECWTVEHTSHNEKEQRTRFLRKEWLAAGAEGIQIHKMKRGLTEMPVEKPFFKLKKSFKKDDEWAGEAKAGDHVVKHSYLVEGEADVEVPAGKFRAWKVRVRIEQGDRHSAEAYEYYAKGVGLVKSELTIRFGGEATTLVSELKEFKRPAK